MLVRPDISEFSFGYAVTEALVQRWRPLLTAAPAFPSLVEEGQVGGGYDVKLMRRGIPIFLQFKLADCMVRATAYEVQQRCLANPFYRMHIRPARHSDQHRMLCDLEGSGAAVRYVAPMFHRTAELNEAYLGQQVLQRSIFLRPSAIGPLTDGGNHHVSFGSRNAWWFFSEPHRGDEPLDEEKFEAEVRFRIRQDGATALTSAALNHLKASMIEIIERHRRRAQRAEDLAFSRFLAAPDPLRQVGYLSRTFFGAECLVVSTTENL